MKIILLGFDGELLKSIVDRVNEQRPVTVSCYTDLKDFLEICIEEQPDLVGISVNYPHPKITRFPKVFRMALNTPVLVFAENQDSKSRKALSKTEADLTIQGVITSHNLWMKIVNFQKMLEEEFSKNESGSTDSEERSNSGTVILKDKRPKIEENKNAILSNLFSALNDDGRPNKISSMNHIKATSPFEKENEIEYGGGSGKPGPKPIGVSHLSGGGDFVQSGNRGTTDVNNKAQLLDNVLQSELEKEERDLASEKPGDPRKRSNFSPAPVGNLSEDDPSDDKKNYGKVQLADAKEVKEDVSRKNKEKVQREQAKKRNVLEVASELALEKVFKAQRAKSILRFDSNIIFVMTVDLKSIKGYLLITLEKPFPNLDLKEFKKALIVGLKEQGAMGDISDAYQLNINVKNYVASISEFSDFNINHQDVDEKYFNIAFVQREVILPQLQDSDKPEMYFVDIKVIPPQTPVTFDAYLFLPKNKRFVRYLKEGRSLSLKQAKRHTEENDGQSQLYLPKEQKKQFEQFYIQNTLSWEFELHKKNDVA